MAVRDRTRERRRDLFEEARAHLEEHHGQGVSLGSVARALGTSRRQLERSFAEAGATTFRAELTRIRLAAAARLLEDHLATVAEVAAFVGYRQKAHFAKAFRQAYGEPPAAWRLENLGIGTPSRRLRERRDRNRQISQHTATEADEIAQFVEERLRIADEQGKRAWPRGLS